MHGKHLRGSSGFTLIEVLVSALLLIVGALSVAQLLALSTRTAASARARTATSFLAAQKMEQLRSLTWSYDPSGGVQSDTYTDISRDPFTASGTGLSPTPPDSLDREVAGCVDYLDGAGRWVGAGPNVPSDAVYLRRWAVLPPADDPLNTRVLVVLTTTISQERAAAGGGARSALPDDTWLISLRTRQLAGP